MKPYYEEENITIYNGDCLEIMPQLPQVDLVLTDPPYGIMPFDWDKNKIDWNILAWTMDRILRFYGTIYIFGQTPMIFKVYSGFSKYFEFRQDLIWYKNRGFSLADTIFTKCHENILYFVKDNREMLKDFGEYIRKQRINLGLSLRDMGKLCNEKWYHRGGHMYFETGLSSPTNDQYNKIKGVLKLDNRYDCLFEKFIFNFEQIQLEGKSYHYKKKPEHKLYGQKNKQKPFIGLNRGKRNPLSVLEYDNIQSGEEYKEHPTQKPIKLLKYLITASSNPNDLILDPFLGSGTTIVACKELGRKGIGIEISKEYCDIAITRLKNTQKDMFL